MTMFHWVTYSFDAETQQPSQGTFHFRSVANGNSEKQRRVMDYNLLNKVRIYGPIKIRLTK